MTIVKDAAAQTVWHPDPGRPVEDGWGDRVANSVFQRFANMADRDTNWVDPPAGALAQTMDHMLLWKWNGVGWEIVGNPPGTIIDLAVDIVPQGYLPCTGVTVPTGTYLRDVLGMTVTPNLIGRSTAGIGNFAQGNAMGTGSFSILQYFGTPNSIVVDHAHVADPPNTGTSHNGDHNHGFYDGHTVPVRNPNSGLGFSVVGNPGHVFWWAYEDLALRTSGGHSHVVDIAAFWTGGASGAQSAANMNFHPLVGVKKLIKV